MAGDVWETTGRIETLVDGIFAIAMTLLVLNIAVPQLTAPVSNATMQSTLISMWPKFFAYGLSFILLAVFWRMNHQQFYAIKRTNSTLLRITVMWLLFVALVPFSASLTAEYGNLQSAEIFFHVNMFLIGVFPALTWYYAVRKNFIDEKIPSERISEVKRIYLILPFLSLIAMGLTFISPSWSPLAYALHPLVRRIVKRI
jgi:uncharacterized membrane protein